MRDNVVLILGKRGSGKSTLAKRVLSRYPRVIVFDPLSEYRNGLIVQSMPAFFEFFERERERFQLVCRFEAVDTDAMLREYEYAARACWELQNLLLVLEECEQFITSNDRQSFINYLISFGRHRHVSLLAIGRRPAEIPIRFRANFTTVAAFNTTEPNDLRILEAYGLDTERVQALPPFEYEVEGENIWKAEASNG